MLRRVHRCLRIFAEQRQSRESFIELTFAVKRTRKQQVMRCPICFARKLISKFCVNRRRFGVSRILIKQVTVAAQQIFCGSCR
jgi:hypothetical protein